MPPISAGVASGSSLAIALKTLNWLDRSSDPFAYCTALGAQLHHRFDWFAFSLGILTGIFVLAVVELIFSLRWAVNAWAGSWNASDRVDRARGSKPLYKLV